MDISKLVYKLYSVDLNCKPINFLGNCFPIGPNGAMLTCRHVVDINLEEKQLAIYDNELEKFTVLSYPPISCQVDSTDMAFLQNALNRPKQEFFPILPSNLLSIGDDVYSFGYLAIGGLSENIESGYFSGRIVNFYQLEDDRKTMFTLPYPVIEGLSGSPVLTSHNGPKLVGIATGNRITRILAAETMEYKDGNVDYKETINRIVEFGTSMHCAAISNFLATIPNSGALITDTDIKIP